MPPRRRSPRKKAVAKPDSELETEVTEEQGALADQDDINNTSSPKRRARGKAKSPTPVEKPVETENENDKENVEDSMVTKLPTTKPLNADETDATIEQMPSPEHQFKHSQSDTSIFLSPKRIRLESTIPEEDEHHTKTVATAPSSSNLPVKKTFQHSQTTDYKLPSETLVSNLFQRKDLKSLTSMLTDLSNTKTERMFNDFRKLTEKKQATTDNLLNNLNKENTMLKTQLKNLKASSTNISKLENDNQNLKKLIEQLRAENKKLQTTTKDLEGKIDKVLIESKPKEVDSVNDELVKELDLFNTKTEILELLTGSSCLQYFEDSENLIFRMKQSSDSCSLVYKLLISKIGVSEIVYIPSLDEVSGEGEEDDGNVTENLEKLKKCLPDYLLDNLTFPSNTLNNFYSKLSRSLNKKI